MDFVELWGNMNWWAVLAATAVSMVWSFAWYSKSLVGKQWMEAVGVKESELEKAYMGKVMPIVTVMTAVGAVMVAMLLQNSSSWVDGLVGGAIIGAGLVASQMLIQYAFSMRSKTLMWIDSVWAIVGFALMGLVVSYF